ncbi:glutathione S-transferase [Zhengella mangrovi]|uniref:Glutathione S-transferase n=1 Tax=Zhengella mangrovi TaxID=1982044 RepID=A0A2G1QNK4_9HYPH|nr:MAPEG family protein [Zhengella mangrovi]PHP67059.1 glutathione S-transferase [Zhengella mangrovi]
MTTTALAATGFYAALNALVLLALTAATGRHRVRVRIMMGDGGDPHLIRLLRGHANAIEAIPMFFVMLGVAALLGAPALAIHALGLPFTIGRGLHALHFIQADAPAWQRSIGFGLSFLAFLVLTIGLLVHTVFLLPG